jgi:hypothetical protein
MNMPFADKKSPLYATAVKTAMDTAWSRVIFSVCRLHNVQAGAVSGAAADRAFFSGLKLTGAPKCGSANPRSGSSPAGGHYLALTTGRPILRQSNGRGRPQ